MTEPASLTLDRAGTGRGARTRRAILDETARLLSDDEPESVTLDRISAAVPISKSSICWHFGTKDELFVAVVDDLFRRYTDHYVAEHPDGGDARDQLVDFLADYATFLEDNPRANTVLFTLLFDRSLDPDVRERIRLLYASFREAIVDNYRIGGQPVSEELAAAVIALVDGVFLQWHLDPDRIVPTAVFAALLQTAEQTTARDPIPDR
jgi:AcrR family transcriptional regulator